MCNIYSKLSRHEKTPKVNQSSRFSCNACARILFWMDSCKYKWTARQMINNEIVADRLLAAEAANNRRSHKLLWLASNTTFRWQQTATKYWSESEAVRDHDINTGMEHLSSELPWECPIPPYGNGGESLSHSNRWSRIVIIVYVMYITFSHH